MTARIKRAFGLWFWSVVIINFPVLVLSGMMLIAQAGITMGMTAAVSEFRSDVFPFVFALILLSRPLWLAATLVACIAMIRPTVSILGKVSIVIVILVSGLLVQWIYRAAVASTSTEYHSR
jgi:hypothetical protein